MCRVEEAYQLARLLLKRQQEIDAQHYNLGRWQKEYTPGELV